MSKVISAYYDLTLPDNNQLLEKIGEFYSIQDQLISSILKKGSEDNELANILKGSSIDEIKSIFTFMSIIDLITNNPELLEKIQSIIKGE